MNTTDTGSSDEPESRGLVEHDHERSDPKTPDATDPQGDDDDAVRQAQSRDAESPGAFIDDPNPPEPNEPG